MPDGRQALLRAATRAFAAYGFEGADVRSIAAAAGVGPNLIRVHFGSKAELWEACLDAIVAAAAPVMLSVAKLAAECDRPLGERLQDVVLHVARFYAANPEVRDFVARHGVESPERATLVAERLLRPAYETVRELFAAGIEAGFIRSSHPALFFALLNSAASQPPAFPALLNQLAPEIAPEAARARMTETIIATLLHRPKASLAEDRMPPVADAFELETAHDNASQPD
jgi:AcrR family transcriptional regulator